MDYTYFVAGFLALLVGFVGAAIFVTVGGNSLRRLLMATMGVTLATDFALLLDWSRTDQMTLGFLLTDLAFFALYAVVGCAIGAAPLLVGRKLLRSFRKAGPR
jgi:hypothetical protein